jgi:adenosylhomocysteine nucleosidase
MILVIGAMEQEINVFKSMIDEMSELTISGVLHYKGTYVGKEVILMLSGVGKINAAINTTVIFENYAISHVINIGTAGGISKQLSFGDVVVSSKVVNHDVDITGFGRAMGELPDQPIYFESNQDLVDKVMKIKDQLLTNIHLGLIATGDQFVHTVEKMEHILSSFPESMACEMEAYAVGRVSHKYKTPFIVVRSISDLVFLEQGYDFNTYLDIASKNSTTILTELIKEIEVA